MRFLVASVILACCSVTADASQWTWKLEPFAASCEEAAGPKLDKDGNMLEGEHDFVLHKCKTKYGPTMWLLYQDSARMSVGFGEAPTVTWTGASLERGNWPIEWGGVEVNGKFEVKTATVRFRWLGNDTPVSGLLIYKINGDQPACAVSSADSNERARQLAAAIKADTKCEREIEKLDELVK